MLLLPPEKNMINWNSTLWTHVGQHVRKFPDARWTCTRLSMRDFSATGRRCVSGPACTTGLLADVGQRARNVPDALWTYI